MKTIIVTGGAGFVGANLIRYLINQTNYTVINVDKLTYAGNPHSLADVASDPRYHFEQTDIGNADEIERIFDFFQPEAVMHLAAESHVDRSIDGPVEFLQTNVVGTYILLETARNFWTKLSDARKQNFRFLHVSTDEVFGTLGKRGSFTEATPYRPTSPYSASKASSDHFVRAWYHTYGLPVLMTNCSNNFGPYQFPEKLIPVVILKALNGKPIPVYGKGENIRDWLYVEDHVRALLTVLENGKPGQTYNIGARNEQKNLDLVLTICRLMDQLVEKPKVNKHEELIAFVTDRPGHDLRYAIDPSKIESDLSWKAQVSFSEGLKSTIRWYLENQEWCNRIFNGSYRLERIGLGGAVQ